MEHDIITRARGCISRLSTLIAPLPSPTSPAPADANNRVATLEEMTTLSGAIIVELRIRIQTTEDPGRLEELLAVNDELLASLKQIPSFTDGTTNNSGGGEAGKRPKLVLQGLGLSFDSSGASGNENGVMAPKPEESVLRNDRPGTPDAGVTTSGGSSNGVASPVNQAPMLDRDNDESGDTTPTTPRIDKGKARAEPEEEEPEKVLSPSYDIGDVDEEDEEEEETGYTTPEEIAAIMPSPTERYVTISYTFSMINDWVGFT